MRRFFIAVVLCTLLYACKPGIPKDIIQPDEMERVLYEIHVVDGYASTVGLASPDSVRKLISPYYKGIYKKYGTDSGQYNRSLDYYYKHPDVMKLMYDHITEKLTKARDKSAKPDAKAALPPKIATVAAVMPVVQPISTVKQTPHSKRKIVVKPIK